MSLVNLANSWEQSLSSCCLLQCCLLELPTVLAARFEKSHLYLVLGGGNGAVTYQMLLLCL